MKVLLIDNNDSFTYNIVECFRPLNQIDFSVILSHELGSKHLQSFNKIIISPGPGKPSDFPIINKVIPYCLKKAIPLLGICLGHQAICQFFGGQLQQLKEVSHGEQKKIIINNQFQLFNGFPKKINVGLYHSWVVEYESLPSSLEVIGWTNTTQLMAVKHRSCEMYGLQFHPESFLTPFGSQIIQNFLNLS